MKNITQNGAKNIIESTKGLMFSVKFIKADKSERKMTARLGVKVHLHGGTSTTAGSTKYIDVFDMHSLGYRKINMETLKELKFNGVSYEVH